MKIHELAVVAFAAMVGGALANVGLAQIKPVMAQNPPKAEAPAQDSVRAKRFELVDESRKTRVLLDVVKGEPIFAMSDSDGNTRLSAQVLASGEAVIGLKGADGKTRLSLITDADGTPTLTLGDVRGAARAKLAMARDGAPSLTLADEGGKERARVSVSKDGEPRVAVMDYESRAGAILRVNGRAPQLELYDRTGKNRAMLAAQEDEMVRLLMTDRDGKLRVALGSLGDGNSLIGLYNGENERALMQADANGRPQIAIAGAKGKDGAALLVDGSGALGWRFVDEQGRLRALLSIDGAGTPLLQLTDANGSEVFKAPR